MTIVDDTSAINSEPVFNAVLTPYRSLGRAGFIVLVAITLAITVFNVIFFLVADALPVAMFFGLDVALLYGAFYLNYRSARAREEVMVSRTELEIRKVAPSGRAMVSRYNPFWAKFQVDRHSEFGIIGMAVTGEGRRTVLGSFLNPDDRESFARLSPQHWRASGVVSEWPEKPHVSGGGIGPCMRFFRKMEGSER